jgi:glycine cleavage system H protein
LLLFYLEGNHPRWGGQTSNLEGDAMRRRVGSTPISFRQILDFLIMKIAELDFPEELWYLPEWDTWARLDQEGVATVGISSLGIALSGELYMCRPKSKGSELEQGRAIAVVELAKSVVSVKSPLTGVVLEVNPLLEDHPELPFKFPYGDGWLAKVQLTRWDQDQQGLRQGRQIEADVRQRMYLYKLLDSPAIPDGN